MSRVHRVLLRVGGAAALFVIASGNASADMSRRNDHGGRTADSPKRGDEPRRPEREAKESEPIAALVRELPSLKVDLKLTADQVGAWSLFERGARELAELDLMRRRRMLAMRDPRERRAGALALISTLAEDDRQRAEAMSDLKGQLETLLRMLSEPQHRLLDARVGLSQTQPLGP